MSIDARITAVRYNDDGTATIDLEPADDTRAPAGQERLIVVNPRSHMDALVGVQVWGSANTIMVRDTVFADRLGHIRIRLRDAVLAAAGGTGHATK